MFEVHLTWEVPPQGMRRAFNQAIREALQQVGEEWLEAMLPEHFTHRGASEYGYAKRGSKYERRKLRKHGHTYPLVWTGTLKEEMARNARVRATSRSVRITMQGPRYMNYRPQGHLLTLSEEARLVSRRDREQLERLAAEAFEKAWGATVGR